MPPVGINDLAAAPGGEPSAAVAARVAHARGIQQARNGEAGINAHLPPDMLERVSPMQDAAKTLLNQSAERLSLSARSYYRLMRVARTVADLDGGAEVIKPVHVAEALSYRRLKLQ